MHWLPGAWSKKYLRHKEMVVLWSSAAWRETQSRVSVPGACINFLSSSSFQAFPPPNRDLVVTGQEGELLQEIQWKLSKRAREKERSLLSATPWGQTALGQFDQFDQIGLQAWRGCTGVMGGVPATRTGTSFCSWHSIMKYSMPRRCQDSMASRALPLDSPLACPCIRLYWNPPQSSWLWLRCQLLSRRDVGSMKCWDWALQFIRPARPLSQFPSRCYNLVQQLLPRVSHTMQIHGYIFGIISLSYRPANHYEHKIR